MPITPITSGSTAYFCALERQRFSSHSPVDARESSQAWKATWVCPACQPLRAISWTIASFCCLERSAESPWSGRSETISLVGVPLPWYSMFPQLAWMP
jgi:hypothetical protein